MKIIGVSEASLNQEEERAVMDVVRSGWISQGEKVAEFEAAFEKMTGLGAVAVSSCTAGLHMVLASLNLKPEDEVLVPGVTFIATVNAVLYAGATPVAIDISPKTPHMDLEAAARAITAKTRAVILMHYGGYRMDISAWKSFAEVHNLVLLEDAAHAPGLSGLGKDSSAAVLSFFANKNITTAEGGMILASDREMINRYRRMRGHGMTSNTLTRAKGHAFSYDVDLPGWNYRMDEIRAALGLVQLNKLQNNNSRRLALSHYYRKRLAEQAPWIYIPFDESWPTAAHLMTVMLPPEINRSKLMNTLKEKGIQTSIHYPPYHHFTWHKKYFKSVRLPYSEEWCSRTLTLPLHPSLTADDVDYVVNCLSRQEKTR